MSDTKSSDESNDGSEETPVVSNKFANDGSFLQMFKQMQQNMKTTNASSDPNKDNKESKDSKNDKIAVDKTVDSTEEKSAPEDGGDGAEQSSSSTNKPFVSKPIVLSLKEGVNYFYRHLKCLETNDKLLDKFCYNLVEIIRIK